MGAGLLWCGGEFEGNFAGVKMRWVIGLAVVILWWPAVARGQSYLKEFPGRHQAKYFEFHYKRNADQIKEIAQFADAFVTLINRDFFKADFEYPIRVLVLEDRGTFQQFLRTRIGVREPPNFGIYLGREKMFVTHEESGLGTFTHEIMHPLVERNLRDRPLWALEGIPTFFEKFYGYWEDGKPIVHWGYHNPWRIEMLGTNLTQLDLKGLLTTRDPQGQYRESDLRMVSMFLWEQGKFQRFLELLQKREKNGYGSYFEAALELPIERVIPLWRRYLEEVSARRGQIMRLPPSAILRDRASFKQFVNTYGIRAPK